MQVLGRTYKRLYFNNNNNFIPENMADCWLDCDFLRCVHQRECLIRLVSTKSVLQVKLTEPLDMKHACLVSELKPVAGRVRLGECKGGKYYDCALEIEWPTKQNMPPPIRFVRTKKPAILQPCKKKRRIL